MSRIARPGVVSPKVYRHFAVVTMAITACVGLFASGESADAFQTRQDRNRLLTAESDKLGARHLKAGNLHLRNERRAYIAFAPDEASDVRNVDGAVDFSSGGDTVRGASPAGEGLDSAAAPDLPPGISPSDPGAREFIRRQAQRPRTAATSGPNAAQVEAILSASNARSGNRPEE